MLETSILEKSDRKIINLQLVIYIAQKLYFDQNIQKCISKKPCEHLQIKWTKTQSRPLVASRTSGAVARSGRASQRARANGSVRAHPGRAPVADCRHGVDLARRAVNKRTEDAS